MSAVVFKVDVPAFRNKALSWAQQFNEIAYLDSNDYKDEYAAVESMLAVQATAIFQSDGSDSFQKLNEFKAKHPTNWMFGFFSYDLKDEIEQLKSRFPNTLEFPECYFFVPSTQIFFRTNVVEIVAPEPHLVFEAINSTAIDDQRLNTLHVEVKQRMSKEDYKEAFEHMQSHIQRGDIYEVNLCQEFYAESVSIDPLRVYQSLAKLSPTPFSCFFKLADKFVLSASPERFLAKRGDTLISQPIKGTARRGKTVEEDQELIDALRNDQKEVAENIMIVDLVRNDLTRSAKPGTVDASRRLEVHSFQQVHQLISTITCQQADDVSDVAAIEQCFPPGSMTGAPKVSAMQLCESYEHSKRGLYAGSIGYFAPNGNFDFNVVIRSILYNQSLQYLSFHTGGAITLDAKMEDEYQECLLKASAIVKVLGAELE